MIDAVHDATIVHGVGSRDAAHSLLPRLVLTEVRLLLLVSAQSVPRSLRSR